MKDFVKLSLYTGCPRKADGSTWLQQYQSRFGQWLIALKIFSRYLNIGTSFVSSHALRPKLLILEPQIRFHLETRALMFGLNEFLKDIEKVKDGLDKI